MTTVINIKDYRLTENAISCYVEECCGKIIKKQDDKLLLEFLGNGIDSPEKCLDIFQEILKNNVLK
jgi:hypothetical protein